MTPCPDASRPRKREESAITPPGLEPAGIKSSRKPAEDDTIDPLPSEAEPFRRADLCAAGGLLLVAAALRFWAYGQVGISHYDEAAYAVTAVAIHEGRFATDAHPLLHTLAPPMVYGLGALAMLLSGAASALALIVPSTLCGALTAPMAFLAARRWCGRAAGIAAGLVVALGEYHVAYSRMGLADVEFGFFFLLTLWLYGEAEARRSLGWAALAGVATGLAWNTKYHGWFAGVIAGAALVPHLLRGAPDRFVDGLKRVLLAALVACTLYLPWFLYVDAQDGGYAGLMKNHAAHVRPRGAPRHILRHVQAQFYLDGWWGRVAPAAGLALATLMLPKDRRLPAGALVATLVCLLLAGAGLGLAVTCALLGALGAWHLLRSGDERAWLPLAFAAVFTVMTPLYVPYIRLLLPWWLAAAVLAGSGIAALSTRDGRTARPPWPVLAVGLAGIVGLVGIGVRPQVATYRPSTGYESAASQLAEAVPDDVPIAVIGEPTLVFYLRAAGRDARHIDTPAQMERVADARGRVTVLQSIYGRATNLLTEWCEAHPGAWTAAGTFEVDPGLIREATDHWPRHRRPRMEPRPRHQVEAYAITLPRE